MGNELCKYLQELLLGGVATDFSEIVATGQERGCCNQFWVGKSTAPKVHRASGSGRGKPSAHWLVFSAYYFSNAVVSAKSAF